MPNWCENTLTITGTEPDVNNFIDDNTGKEEGTLEAQPLLFSKSYPEPEEADNEDWWDWRVSHWGTKWEPKFRLDEGIETEIKKGPGKERIKSATYRFETAWSPPEGWLAYVSEKYPDLVFCLSYAEEGMDFGGVLIYEKGNLIDHSEGEAIDYAESGSYQ